MPTTDARANYATEALGLLNGLQAMTSNLVHRGPLAVKELKDAKHALQKAKCETAADKKKVKATVDQLRACADLMGDIKKTAKDGHKAYDALLKAYQKCLIQQGDYAAFQREGTKQMRKEAPLFKACQGVEWALKNIGVDKSWLLRQGAPPLRACRSTRRTTSRTTGPSSPA